MTKHLWQLERTMSSAQFNEILADLHHHRGPLPAGHGHHPHSHRHAAAGGAGSGRAADRAAMEGGPSQALVGSPSNLTPSLEARMFR